MASFLLSQADSGYDLGLYRELASEARVLLIDGRAKASAEHAGFQELLGIGESDLMARRRLPSPSVAHSLARHQSTFQISESCTLRAMADKMKLAILSQQDPGYVLLARARSSACSPRRRGPTSDQSDD